MPQSLTQIYPHLFLHEESRAAPWACGPRVREYVTLGCVVQRFQRTSVAPRVFTPKALHTTAQGRVIHPEFGGKLGFERKVFMVAGLPPANLPAKLPANWREGPAIVTTGEELTDPGWERVKHQRLQSLGLPYHSQFGGKLGS